MDLTDAPTTPPVKQTLSHTKTIRPSETPSEQTAASVSLPAVPKAAGQSVYPSATRRLPGNKDATGLPVFGRTPELLDRMAAKRVYERVLSLQAYLIATLTFSLVIIFFIVTNQIMLQWQSALAIVQLAECAALVVPIATSWSVFTSRNIGQVQAVLKGQMIGYLIAFAGAFLTIVNNFAYFFSGTGVLALVEAGFWLWTRSVLDEVGDLPGAN